MTLLVAAIILAAALALVAAALAVLIVNANKRPRGRTEEV